MAEGMVAGELSAETVRETAVEGFELAIRELKAQGGEAAALAEMADTAMLLWQLADQDTDLARQTIGEYLPELLGKIRQMSE